jgi:hypothetical protein
MRELWLDLRNPNKDTDYLWYYLIRCFSFGSLDLSGNQWLALKTDKETDLFWIAGTEEKESLYRGGCLSRGDRTA